MVCDLALQDWEACPDLAISTIYWYAFMSPGFHRFKDELEATLQCVGVMGAPYREVNSKVATAPNTQSRR